MLYIHENLKSSYPKVYDEKEIRLLYKESKISHCNLLTINLMIIKCE
jgi:hypothetical protein